MADFNQVVSASPIIKLGAQTVTYSTTEPTSPANGDLWYEPGSRYAAPWEWETSSGLWLGQPQDVFFGSLRNLTSSVRIQQPTEFYAAKYGTGKSAKLVFVNIYIKNGGTACTATNYYRFYVEYLLGTNVFTEMYSIPENTGTNPSPLAAYGARRINITPNLYFPANAWTMGFVINKEGAPSDLGEVSTKYTIRYPRP